MSFDYASAQYASEKGYRERYVLGEGTAPLERSIALPATHVRATTRGAALLFHAFVTRLLRVSALALYLFPLLVIAKIVLFFSESVWSDYITVGFVLLVVVFFAFFALTVLSYAIVGPRSKRATALAFEPPSANDVERVVARFVPNATARVTGRVHAGLASGEPVLVEEWERGASLARFVEARSFAILPDDGTTMPCAVAIAGAPVLVAQYADDDESARALTTAANLRLRGDAREPAPRSRCVLRQGQRVAIIARKSELATGIEDRRLLEHIADDGPGGPYRGAETQGIVVRSTAEEPLVIQLLD